MIKSKNIFIPLVLTLAFSIIYSSCKKSDRDDDKELSAAKDNALSENIFAGIFKSIGEGVDSTWQVRSSTCVTYSISPADTFTFPKTLTIDFDTINCLCNDGNFRRGKIIATFNGKYRDSLTVINITLQNYYHNNNRIQASGYSIKNNGHNSAENLTYTITVQNAAISTTDGSIAWSSVHTREWIAGDSTTLNPFDDVYSITGTTSGRGINGNTFTATINSPLIVALNCAYIEKGSFTLTPANLSPRLVDFGNGSCDAQATITINGKSYDLTL